LRGVVYHYKARVLGGLQIIDQPGASRSSLEQLELARAVQCGQDEHLPRPTREAADLGLEHGQQVAGWDRAWRQRPELL
jgi:hypothetical protein